MIEARVTRAPRLRKQQEGPERSGPSSLACAPGLRLLPGEEPLEVGGDILGRGTVLEEQA
jgi:hypothetical protein